MEQTIRLKGNIIRRIGAAIIDYGLLYGFCFAYLLYFGTPVDEGLSVSGVMALPVPILWFVLIVVTEQGLGSTIGNGIMGLKPLTLTGNKPCMMQSFKRHLLDFPDMCCAGLVGIIAIMNTEKKQRLGDLWAKTIVVRA